MITFVLTFEKGYLKDINSFLSLGLSILLRETFVFRHGNASAYTTSNEMILLKASTDLITKIT